jgi:plastocyanin
METRKHRRGRGALAAALAAAALASIAIGLGSGGAAAAGENAQTSSAATVRIADFAFHPPTLRVARGSQVVFANRSNVTHTATRDGSFESGLIKPGKSFTFRFKQKGSFAYRCLIHPSMRGRVIVE